MQRLQLALALPIALTACVEPTPPSASAEESASESSSGGTSAPGESESSTTAVETSDETETEAGTETETETETGEPTETETGDPTETETETGPMPDLPPECSSWDEAEGFDELCLEDLVHLSPGSFNYVTQIGWNDPVYVSGASGHRLYHPFELVEDSPGTQLDMEGTTLTLFEAWLDGSYAYLALTRAPNTITLLGQWNLEPTLEVIPLSGEPTAIDFFGIEGPTRIYVVAYTDSRLEFFRAEMGTLVFEGERVVPETIHRFQTPNGWDYELVGLSRGSSTMWGFELPIMDPMSALVPWELAPAVLDFRTELFSDFGPHSLLGWRDEPSELFRYNAFDVFDPNEQGSIDPLDHTLREINWGSVPWTWKNMFALSDDDHMGVIGRHDDIAADFYTPSYWAPMPPNTVAFDALSGNQMEGLVLASETEGLFYLGPVP